jgi:hypothetical protein
MQEPDLTIESRDPLSLPSEGAKTPPRASIDCPKGRFSGVVELLLSPEQEVALAPLVRSAVAARSNVVFVGASIPRSGTWVLQVKVIAASAGAKLRRLLDADKEEPTKEADRMNI